MQGKILCVVVAASLTLQGCNQAPTANALEGAWIPINQSCDSGGAWFLKEGGIFASEEEEGVWSLDDSQLTIRTTGIYDFNGTSDVLMPADITDTFQILSLNGNILKILNTENVEVEMKNCSAPAAVDAENDDGGLLDTFNADPNIYLGCVANGGATYEWRITPPENGQGMISAYSAASNAYIPNSISPEAPQDEGASVQIDNDLIVINYSYAGDLEFRVNRNTGAFLVNVSFMGRRESNAGECYASENMVSTERQF